MPHHRLFPEWKMEALENQISAIQFDQKTIDICESYSKTVSSSKGIESEKSLLTLDMGDQIKVQYFNYGMGRKLYFQ